jgi:hypothetical protein
MTVDVEYVVEVDQQQKVRGRLTHGAEQAEFGPEDIRLDRERSSTIRVLQEWLNRWTALTRAGEKGKYKGLPVQETFSVLGQHLYAVLFHGAVESGFEEARTRATGSSTLRVRLSFALEAQELARLPWELLYRAEGGGHGDFMAKAHRLVLSRRLQLRNPTPTVPASPPIVVRFLVAMPETEAYRQQRADLVAELRKVSEYTQSIVPEVLEHWSDVEAAEMIDRRPYPQVVHVVGLAKRVREQGVDGVRLCLDDERGGVRWAEPRTLLALFDNNGGRAPADQIRLVILHLCEPSPLDFEVTFERLAPELIRKGIPAVLALQYPLIGTAAGRFVQSLYEGLVRWGSIEAAVQSARSDLFNRFETDRLFGAPVLYMQRVDSELFAVPPAVTEAGPATVSAAERPARPSAEFLQNILGGIDRPAAIRAEAEDVIVNTTWAGTWPDLHRQLARQVRTYAHRPDLAEVFQVLVAAAVEEQGRASRG